MLQKSDSVTKIAKAVLGVQKDLKPAFKGSNNPYFKSKYADLNACWDAVRDLLQKNDLVLIQMPCVLLLQLFYFIHQVSI
jgi:hypothetical protein